jgi:nitrogen regulatory protein P-II 1
MKKIEAIIKEEHLGPVKTALEAAGFVGMTITPVKGRGTSGGITLEWRAGSYQVDFLNKLLLMLVVPTDRCQQAVDLIIQHCREDASGGAGKIFISPVDEVIRIRTGERDLEAL